jgi:bifunctional DNase/RNase
MTDVQPEVTAEGEAAEPTAAAEATHWMGATSAAPPVEETLPATAPEPTPTFRVMDVEDVSVDLPTQYPAVTLVESQPPMRALVFPVGMPEGTAMAQALRRMESRRPMTHELFMQVLQRARIDVIALRLTGREEGNLLAELDLMTPGGRERVDCRPSDGIVLALRMPVPAPILVDERLLDQVGDVVPFEEAATPGRPGSDQITS